MDQDLPLAQAAVQHAEAAETDGTAATRGGFANIVSAYGHGIQANISDIFNTLSLKVYCGISGLFANACDFNEASDSPVTAAPADTEEVVGTERPFVYDRTEGEDTTTYVTGADSRKVVVEKVIERIATPFGIAGVSTEYVDARIAQLAEQLRSEMADRTVTVRTASRSSGDSLSSRQIDSIYEDMDDQIEDAIDGLNDYSEQEIIDLILANSSTLDAGPAGYVLQSTGTTTAWVATTTLGFVAGSSSQWDDVTGGINYTGGNIGIGNTNPLVALDVVQAAPVVRLTGTNTSGYVASGYVGQYEFGLYGGLTDEKIATFDSDMNEFYYGNGNFTVDGTLTRSFLTVNAPRFTSNDGDANDPAFAFGADTNVGIFRPGTDALAITTGGTERMRINASGNVGIGTTTPLTALEVYGGASNLPNGLTLSQSGGSSGRLFFYNGTAASGHSIYQSSGSLLINTGATPGSTSGSAAMTITGTGSVGIGTTTPSAKFAITATAGTGDIFAIASSTNARLLTVTSAGFVGIGTTNPLASVDIATGNLHVRSGTVSANTFSNYNNAGDLNLFYQSGTFSISRTAGTSLRVDGSGNVGIGTTTPTAKLDIWGSLTVGTSSTPTLSVSTSGGKVGINTTAQYAPLYVYSAQEKTALFHRNTTANLQSVGLNLSVLTGFSDQYQKAGILFQRDDSFLGGFGGGKLIFAVNNTADNSNISASDARMVILPTGNVGVGTTTPVARFAVTGASGSTSDLLVLASSTNARLFTVTSAGNVGIGTTTPGYALTVAGDISLTGALRTSGSAGTSGYVLQTTGTGVQWVATSTLGISSGVDLANLNPILVGRSNNSNIGTDSTIFGYQNSASGTQSVSLGISNTATTTNAIAIGYNNQAVVNSGAVAIGNGNVSSGISGFAFGGLNTVTAQNAVAFGYNNDSRVNSGSSIGVGNSIQVNGTRASAIGYSNLAYGTNSVALGYDNSVTTSSYNGIAVGHIINISAVGASAFGHNISNTVASSTQIGPSDTAKITILSSGNLGVGTTTPEQKLAVIGGAQFTGVGSGAYAFDLNLTSDGTLTTSASDERLKENIETLDTGETLEKLLRLKPSTFDWKSNGAHDVGLIAQEVEEIFPELVFTNKTDGYKGVNYSRLPALLIAGIQEINNTFGSFIDHVEDGIAYINEIVVKRFTAKQITVQNEELYKTGVTIYDQKTGEPICMFVYDGKMETEPGRCEDREEPEEEEDDGQNESDDVDNDADSGDQTGDGTPAEGGGSGETGSEGDAGNTGTGSGDASSGTGNEGATPGNQAGDDSQAGTADDDSNESGTGDSGQPAAGTPTGSGSGDSGGSSGSAPSGSSEGTGGEGGGASSSGSDSSGSSSGDSGSSSGGDTGSSGGTSDGDSGGSAGGDGGAGA